MSVSVEMKSEDGNGRYVNVKGGEELGRVRGKREGRVY